MKKNEKKIVNWPMHGNIRDDIVFGWANTNNLPFIKFDWSI